MFCSLSFRRRSARTGAMGVASISSIFSESCEISSSVIVVGAPVAYNRCERGLQASSWSFSKAGSEMFETFMRTVNRSQRAPSSFRSRGISFEAPTSIRSGIRFISPSSKISFSSRIGKSSFRRAEEGLKISSMSAIVARGRYPLVFRR